MFKYRTGIIVVTIGSAVCYGVLLNSPFMSYLALRALIFGTAAIGIQFLLSRAGELSFGHSLFFGISAYAYGLIGGTDSTLGFIQLLALGLLLNITAAAFLGVICLRIKGVYFTLLTLAAAESVRVFCSGLYDFTGGDNGIQSIAAPPLLTNQRLSILTVAIIAISTVLLFHLIGRTAWGARVDAERQSPKRAAALGVNPSLIHWQAFVVSSVPTSIAGTLFAATEASIHPELFGWRLSGDLIAMVLLGGVSVSVGPFGGAIILDSIKVLLGSYTDRWPLILGFTILVILYVCPRGMLSKFSLKLLREQNNANG